VNVQTYANLHSIVFSGNYPGYRPDVRELPNGDGKVDSEKRYAHIANKYLDQYLAQEGGVSSNHDRLRDALLHATYLAWDVAQTLGVPAAFLPHLRYGALRVLEYPVGATSNLHTDFDLFTLMIYRDQPECFRTFDLGHHTAPPSEQDRRLGEARRLNAQLHIGELGEVLGLGPATPHEVIASERPQHSIVYFAIPDHAAVLPSGITVGAWIAERMSRSRTSA
jgi:hypothetical protein